MYRKLLAGTTLLALAAAPAVAFAAPPASSDSPTGYAIVTFKDSPLATYQGGTNGMAATKPERGRLDPTSPAYRAYERFLANERASYKAFVAQKLPGVKVVAEYDTVLNGVAVELNGAGMASLKKHPKVASVDASWTYQPTMNESVDIINAQAVWDTLEGDKAGAGKDVKVGIIDSGIRDDHPFFQCKAEENGGKGIQHQVYASGVAGSGADIVSSHGTHVAGTVGGCVTGLSEHDLGGPLTEGEISGVAPGVTLADYNVFPGYGGGYVAFGGSAFSHDIAAAVEDAVDDGMHVINLSLGGTVQGKHDYLAEAINAAAAAGVVPVVSAGNEGPGAYTVGSPGNAEDALTVGATTNSRYVGVNVLVEGLGKPVGAAVGDFDPFTSDNIAQGKDLVAWDSEGDMTACSGSTPGSAEAVEDAVVLIQRGGCTFSEKVASAAAAGAFGVLVSNNVPGDPFAMAGAGEIPAVMISQADGAALLQLATTGDPTVDIDGSTLAVIPTQQDILADFSSRGPGPFLGNLKPDVVAPGVNIYSSVFDEANLGTLGWAMYQGTSMAAPHVAGAAALLIDGATEDGRTLTPADVKSLLGNNADRVVSTYRLQEDETWELEPATVLERGGGRINLDSASKASVTFDPMSLSFGVSNGNRPVSKTITVTVTDLHGADGTLTITDVPDHLEVSSETVSVEAGTATFDVTLSTRGAMTEEGDLTITSEEGETFLVPYYFSTGN